MRGRPCATNPRLFRRRFSGHGTRGPRENGAGLQRTIQMDGGVMRSRLTRAAVDSEMPLRACRFGVMCPHEDATDDQRTAIPRVGF